MADNYFNDLYALDVTDEAKKASNGLSYLPWAVAWCLLKEMYPDSGYTVYENPATGLNWFTDGFTAYVKTGVTVNGIEHIEYLPVMTGDDKASMPVAEMTSFDVYSSIQRSLTKAIARHGLGLRLYMGTDENRDPGRPSVKARELPRDTAEDIPVMTLEEARKTAITGIPSLSGKTLGDLEKTDKAERWYMSILNRVDPATDLGKAAGLLLENLRKTG